MVGILVAYDSGRHFTSLLIEKENAGWSEQAEALQQCEIVVRVGRYIGLQQHEILQAALNPRVTEGIALHFLASHAPIGIKIEHHRFAISSGDALVEFLQGFDGDFQALFRGR